MTMEIAGVVNISMYFASFLLQLVP